MKPTPEGAAQDLSYIKEVLDRTQRRIDPHAFHGVHWGLIVLLWYPLANWFQNSDTPMRQLPLGIVAVVCGCILSIAREVRLGRKPRLQGEDTFITRQVTFLVYGLIGAGVALSAMAPATGFVAGPNVPIIWGLIYSIMAYSMGVVYRNEFIYSAGFIFAGTIAAMFLQQWNGYILGPTMGLGMIVPGIIAERRVKLMVEEDVVPAARAV